MWAGRDGNWRVLGLVKGRRETGRRAGEKKQGKKSGPGENQRAAVVVEYGGGQPMAEPKPH